jgi:hypothetical protein
LSLPHKSHTPRQHSGEIQPILRKTTTPMVDETMTSFFQGHSDVHHSSSSSPSNQSGEYQQTQIMGEAIPVPVADITKHLSGLEFNEQNSLAVPMQSDTGVRTAHLRKQSSGGIGGPHRRSVMHDNANSRSNGSGAVAEGSHKVKEAGIKERASLFVSNSLSSSRKRGKVGRRVDSSVLS